jgi:hypothetical protein
MICLSSISAARAGFSKAVLEFLCLEDTWFVFLLLQLFEQVPQRLSGVSFLCLEDK